MGLEFTRGNSTRCPPFLVGGLMIMCLFLLCSWWSLSSQNFELLRQNDNLAEQLRINGEELRKSKDCQALVKEQEARLMQLKDSDQELQQQCQKQEDELNEMKKTLETELKEKAMCHTEMESLKKVGASKDKSLEALRIEKNSLEKDLAEKNEKIAELEKKVSAQQPKQVQGENDVVKNTMMKIIARNMKNKENLDEQKISNNKATSTVNQENPESTLMKDENNAGEMKLEDSMIEPGDPREEEMGMNVNNGDN